MSTKTHALAWAEIPATDFGRAKKFYEKILDGGIDEMPMGEGKMGVLPYDPAKSGVGAAIVTDKGYVPSSDKGSIVYLDAGEDLTGVLNRVQSAGGKILQPKTEIPGMGYFAFLLDSEGNKVGLYSPK